MFHEYVGNVHLHTTYSDGHETPEKIARLAEDAGLDFVIPTDHDVYTPGLDGWYGNTLLLMGQEVAVSPPGQRGNHYLIFDVYEDMAIHNYEPQELIDAVRARGGLGFIAHPFERAAPRYEQPSLPWWDWQCHGYTGLSIWNYMSEFKSYLSSVPRALFAAYSPKSVIQGPFPETLAKWDQLLLERPVSIIGTSDAHGEYYSLGPFRRQIFPYQYLFRCVNLHILCPKPFTGEWQLDKDLVYAALRHGIGFVGYDLLGRTNGFRFRATAPGKQASMGGEIALAQGLILHISAPLPAHLRLIWHGEVVAEGEGQELSFAPKEAGAYRAEAYRRHRGRLRGWIFSNPIYVRRDGGPA